MNRLQAAGLALLSVLVFLIASFPFRPVSAQVNIPREVQKWDYKVLHSSAKEPVFNELGNQGWELCGAPATAIFVFKRPRP